MVGRVTQVALWSMAILLALGLAGANLWLGELNQDEGLYLYAAREVAHGRLPFVDFASTQGPVMALAYVAARPLVVRWGVAGGRFFTLGLGLAGCASAGWLAARLAGPPHKSMAAFVASVLIGVNVYQSYFTVIVKTYALTAFLLASGFLLLSFRNARCGGVVLFGAGMLLALAGAVRLSALVAIPVVGVWLTRVAWPKMGAGRREQVRWNFRPFLWFAAGAGATLLAVFLPFVVFAPRAVYFGLIEYHAARKVGGLLPLLAYKAGFLSRFVQAYFVAVCLLFFHALRRLLIGKQQGSAGNGANHAAAQGDARLARALWATFLFTSLVHVLAPFPYDDYQVIVFPLLAAALGAGVSSWEWNIPGISNGPAREVRQGAACLGLIVCCAMAALSSPINQSWFIGRRDRIWWPLKDAWPLAQLGKAADIIRAHCEPHDLLLTQDLYLAVEADRTVPVGLELGPFSYFPEWPRDKAEKCHVVNRAMLMEILEKVPARIAAFSEWGLAIASPQIVALEREERSTLRAAIERRYRLIEEFERFGQAETRLEVRVLAQ